MVAAASYEARKLGVHSAMPCSQAERLCPQALFVRPRFDAYREVSRQIMEIFRRITDAVEPLSLADAIRRSRIEWIGVRHEEGAALAAAGQAKLTGQLAVCAGTTGPGSNHLVAGLYEASRDPAPVLALSGDTPRKLHGIDFIQTTEPDLLFRDVSLYTETVSSPAQAPTVIHHAYAGLVSPT